MFRRNFVKSVPATLLIPSIVRAESTVEEHPSEFFATEMARWEFQNAVERPATFSWIPITPDGFFENGQAPWTFIRGGVTDLGKAPSDGVSVESVHRDLAEFDCLPHPDVWIECSDGWLWALLRPSVATEALDYLRTVDGVTACDGRGSVRRA